MINYETHEKENCFMENDPIHSATNLTKWESVLGEANYDIMCLS